MGEVFNLKGEWLVLFDGRITGGWSEKGPALACLDLLRKGLGSIVAPGTIRWKGLK